jgi:hypothetical protein
MAYNNILNNLAINPECIYLAIGSALPYINDISRQQHQQYPDFLDYFSNKKLIILIDTRLEFPLKLQDHVNFTDDNIEFNETFTKFTNNEMTVYSVPRDFYLTNNTDISFLQQLLTYVKNNKKHLIIETFTGEDNRLHFYNIVMQMPDYEEILKYAKCDLMDADNGCYSNFTDIVIPIENNHFMHPLLMELRQIRIKYPLIFRKIVKIKYNNLYEMYKYYKSVKYNINENINKYRIQMLLIQYVRKFVPDLDISIVEEALLTFVHELLIVTDNDLQQIEQFKLDLNKNNHNFMKNVFLLYNLL